MNPKQRHLDAEQAATLAAVEREETLRLLDLARANGWRIPDPEEDSHGPAAWAGYWRQMERQQATGARWRPVRPHTVGSRGPEDIFARAQRINCNVERWRGILT